jgi:septal ring factor EnvC (AmiA/AmiB activator)
MRQAGDESSLERARRRLNAAVDTLEAAINRRHEEQPKRDALEAQIQAFGSDRSKLAAELDHVRARSGDLEAANREVSRRLENAVDTIRAVLAAHER